MSENSFGWTGDKLFDLVNSEKPKRETLVSGLIYAHSSLMIFGDTSSGKSSLSLQTALSLTSQSPVYGNLAVNDKFRVYYLLRERDISEPAERIQIMQRSLSWDKDAINIDDEFQGESLTRVPLQKEVIRRVIAWKAQIVFIDPIGAWERSLAKEESASDLMNFFTLLAKQTGVTLWLTHHIHRNTYFEGKKTFEDDPYFGSSRIKNYVTGSYLVTKTATGTEWNLKKSSHSNLLHKLELEYDNERHLSFLKAEYGTTYDSLLLFLNSQKVNKNLFKFSDLQAHLGVSTSWLRNQISTPPFDTILKRHKTSGKPTLYEFLGL